MKVYRSLTIDMNTGEVEAEDSYEYFGPVTECKGGKGGGDGGASQARADEQERQNKIREGTKRVNKIFDGETINYSVHELKPEELIDGKTYYTEGGKPVVYKAPQKQTQAAATSFVGPGGASWQTAGGNGTSNNAYNPAMGPGGGNNVFLPAATQKYYRDAKQKVIPGAFNDDFFNQRRDGYLQYATPQLDEQFKEAQRQLVFSLDRSGLTDSTVRAAKEAELQQMYDTQKRAIADKASAYANDARTSVEDARQNLIATLNATGDVQGAVNSAMARSKALSQPEAYSPLGQLFGSFTSALGQQAAIEKAATLANSFGNGATLYGGSKKSVQTT